MINLNKGSFIKSVITLISGTTIAQLIPIIISPVLTRIYSPQDFGTFSFYLSLVAVISIFASGRYELAVMLPKRNIDSFHLVFLSIFLSLFAGIFTMTLVLLFGENATKLIGKPEVNSAMYLIPLSIAIIGALKAFTYGYNRESNKY